MRKYKFHLVLAALSLLTTGMKAQTDVTPYTPGVTAEGVTYYLPRTQLHITVTATATTYTPGDFQPYALAHLRLTDVISEPHTEWKLDRVTIEAAGVPDKEKIYSVKLRKNTSAPLVGLTDDGILLSINSEGKQPQALAELPAPILTDNSLNPRDYMTQEILAAGSKAKMAQLTAEEIYDIRESRSELTKGEADYMPKDGEQLKLMLARLDVQEKALLQLFKGTQQTKTCSFRYSFIPTSDGEKAILFRFSKKLGPVDSDNLAGEPVYISIKDLHTVPAPTISEDAKLGKKKELNDIRYNVPGKAEVKLTYGQQQLCENTFSMGQFGNIEHLGEDLFNKKMGTRVLFNAVTGGLDKLEAEQPR